MKKHTFAAIGLSLLLGLGGLLTAQGPDPWTAANLMPPETLAKMLNEKSKPMILYVGFPVLYRAAHIPGAILAGPASKPEGLELLRKALANVPKSQMVVIYCGCCPWNVCPNVRPAFQALKQMGFQNAKLVTIPTNVHTDWTLKGYPLERSAGN